ncbi:MAG: sialate O-acetylesterase [Bacteroidales bacterium]|nr:sialate O-acetylesterase [Bacteroidales bacterium]
MKTKALITALALGTALMSCTDKAPKEEKYLYLCIGQSNMVGKGIVAPEDTIPESRFLSLSATNADDGRKIGEWRLAQSGNCRPGEHYPMQVSPTDYFGRTMVDYLPENVTVGILQVGVDGCPMRMFDRESQFPDSIHPDWMEGQIAAYDHNPHGRLVTLARQAIEEGWVIKGLLVHQGETDAYSDYWPKELSKVYNQIREELGVTDEWPILVGEAVGIDQNGVCAHANPTLDRVHDFLPNAYTISSYGCEASEDDLHFSAAGYRKLGRRYAVKMLQLMGYDIETDPDFKLQIELGDPSDAFQVDVTLDSTGKSITVASIVPLAGVDLVSYSGETLEVLKFDNQRVVNIDISKYDNEDRIVLNIRSNEGATVNRQVNR